VQQRKMDEIAVVGGEPLIQIFQRLRFSASRGIYELLDSNSA